MIYNNVELYNVEAMAPCGDQVGFKLSRIPEEVRSRMNERAQSTAFFTCGCEIRFNMVSDSVKLVLKRDQLPQTTAMGVAEVYYGPFQGPYWICPSFVGAEPSEIVIDRPKNMDALKRAAEANGLPYDPELIRVILPYDLSHILLDMEGETAPPRPGQTPAVKYLSYGSSITHGGSAVRPTGSYTMRTARQLGVDLINLGFAGSAQLDEAAADYIAARKDWSFATIELGINVIDQWEPEFFRKKVDYFVSRIAEANPDKWIFIIDMFMNEKDFAHNPKALAYRDIVRRKVESLHLPKLAHLPGTELLTQCTGLSADLLHPSEQGFEEIAGSLTRIMRAKGVLA